MLCPIVLTLRVSINKFGQRGHCCKVLHFPVCLVQRKHQSFLGYLFQVKLLPEQLQESGINLMYAGNIFLGLGHIVVAVFLNQVRITHPNKRVVIIKEDFRLCPPDDFTCGRIRLNPAAHPDGVSVVISIPGALRMFPDKTTAVVVKPVEELAVVAAPGEIGGTGMLHQPAIIIFFVLRRFPGMPAVPTIGLHRMPINGAINAVDGTVAQE